jgi:hypothetical protein
MVSSSGSILEATAITANRALISNASGIPVHSSVTNTELGHLSGVTSAIQTQLNGKEPSFTKNTGFNKNFGTTAGTVAEGNDSRFHNAVTLGTANGLSLVGQELSLSLSSTSTTGALSSTDWNTFNNKLTSLLNSTNIFVGSSSNVATARALSLNATGGTFGLSNTGVLTFPNASSSLRGLLTSTDWSTFNGKENVLTFSTGLNRVGNTITNTITQYTDALARAAISLTTSGTSGVSTYNSTTGVFNIPQYQAALTNPITGTGTAGQVSFWNGTNTQTGDSGFLWDDTSKRLGIGTSTERQLTVGGNQPGIHLKQTNQTGVAAFGDIRFFDQNDTELWRIGSVDTSSSNFRIMNQSNADIIFGTNGVTRWSVSGSGILTSNGSQTIQTSTGDLTLQGNGGRSVFGARTRHTPITAPTTGLNAGDMYYDSTSNRMRFRRTSDWVEMGMLWDTVGW